MGIRERRRAAGMSQAQLARAAQVAQPNLSAYENGRRTPTEAVLQRITRALEIPIADRVSLHRNAIRELVIKHHASEPRGLRIGGSRDIPSLRSYLVDAMIPALT